MRYFIKNLWFQDSSFNYLREYPSNSRLQCALFAAIAGIPKKVSVEVSQDGLEETWIIERI